MASEQIVTLEKLRDELVKNALQIRRGDITPNEGNAIANSLKGAIQAEESRLRRDQGILVTAEPQTMEASIVILLWKSQPYIKRNNRNIIYGYEITVEIQGSLLSQQRESRKTSFS